MAVMGAGERRLESSSSICMQNRAGVQPNCACFLHDVLVRGGLTWKRRVLYSCIVNEGSSRSPPATTHAPMTIRRLIRLVLLLCAVIAAGSLAAPCAQAEWYGYEDPLGMLHLSRTKKNDKYKPLKNLERGKGESNTEGDAERYEKLVKSLRENDAIDDPEGPLTGFTNLPEVSHARGIPSSLTPQRWASRPYPHPSASSSYMKFIRKAAKRHSLDPLLVYCVAELESGFVPGAVSPKGAQGLMQIMPGTQRELGLTSPFDPAANIAAGARYLRWMMNKFKSVPLALAAYNAGPDAVLKYGGVPPYGETRRYVALIMSRYGRLKGLEVSGSG
ncbi:lytic transglycosylase domain-containing protein [Oceanidesulfovibrio marinus]|uniref:Lytic transglycosylase domain-containing protein n=2 Tax=Oceanidesulfovibrio marinus TaxID=370038 RepID=A0ABX6NC05_9BACT|nr:lytic transglycosylase domain-containing protein [Oceanidesulfovibrio marinus]